jgi:hypothetical protein
VVHSLKVTSTPLHETRLLLALHGMFFGYLVGPSYGRGVVSLASVHTRVCAYTCVIHKHVQAYTCVMHKCVEAYICMIHTCACLCTCIIQKCACLCTCFIHKHAQAYICMIHKCAWVDIRKACLYHPQDTTGTHAVSFVYVLEHPPDHTLCVTSVMLWLHAAASLFR